MPWKARDINERFWEKVDKSAGPDGCWLWQAQVHPRGYGRFAIGSRTDKTRQQVPAHRVAYELGNGPIPEGHYVCHRCDNPPCCNPAHLFTGTQQENMNDMKAKGRQNKPRGDRNGSRTHPESRPRGDAHWKRRARLLREAQATA